MQIKNLEEAFNEMLDFITDSPLGIEYFDSDFEKALDEIEMVKAYDEQKEKHGFWIMSKLPNGYNSYKCSVCGTGEASTISEETWAECGFHDYCGACGAKMDERSK